MAKIFGIIPARYASTRFPGKPLADIHGMSMVMRVYHQAQKAGIFDKVAVATDDERIYEHVHGNGGLVVMTYATHLSGTERCSEVAEKWLKNGKASSGDVVINIQGDEPYIAPEQIKKIAALFSSPAVSIATLIKKLVSEAELYDENIVKAVPGAENRLLYFSRLPVPFMRNVPRDQWLKKGKWYKHIGMYAYRISTLMEISKLSPVDAEQSESLEQLRWLAHAYPVYYAETSLESVSVDHPDDLLKLINKA